jgi:phosphatidate cytidylyltransferase
LGPLGIPLPKRELFAIVAIPLLVAAIVWAPSWVLLAVLGAAVMAAGYEFLAMSRASRVSTWVGLPMGLLAALMMAAWWWDVAGLAAVAVATVIILPAAQLARADAPDGSLAGSAVSCFVVLYLGLTGACLGWLRLWPEPDFAVRLLLLFLGSIWVGDSGAYYVGSRLGRHKMSPRISPNKTWEGLAGGTVATYAAAVALKIVLGLELGWIHLAAVATILVICAPLGDLVESQFKRDTGIKDSSRLIPGHGGLLDRTDSLLYAAPPVLGYLILTGLVR